MGVRRSELTQAGNGMDFAFRIYWRIELWGVAGHISHDQSTFTILKAA
jgi:hypothetical protein